MKDISRKDVVKGAAWSLPVIAMAVAAPTASASAVYNPAVSCTANPNHGHGGETGSEEFWTVAFANGEVKTMSNADVQSDHDLKKLCGPYGQAKDK